MTTTQRHATRIKLCGLRGSDDARAAVLAGADAIGIVLVPGTRRFVPPPTAAAMVRAVRETAAEHGRFTPEIVGVVGQLSLAVAARMVAQVGVDAVQLVGEDAECMQFADALGATPIIRSIGLRAGSSPEAVRDSVDAWRERGARIVFDAAVANELGGTGQRVDLELVRALLEPARDGIAGGLDPDNVAAVIRALSPALVDVSSGIESDAGHKDPARMRAFVAAARAATLDELPDSFLADEEPSR